MFCEMECTLPPNTSALPNMNKAIANTCHSRFILEICTESRAIKNMQCEELFNATHLNDLA